ncbi:hypothetical protein Poly24_31400 [Rosistilla carotiformis]|uniref:Uncharacterized protein n=1 Tax=Rosistilla carotiformis TaxID=2528017 RepID=A0A518JV47_9BACT|nr:DUF5343 domain-containing protein [Rosistilla carotiformis]QDV69424.1 hypothetical protein Poly24_31400 [Rosistilla carotiformis]
MATFTQTQNTGNLQEFINGIPSRGVPDKVTNNHLEGLGYKSKNDRAIITVLKFIGVLESNGAPSAAYKKLRNKHTAPSELAALIKIAYRELFKTYPDAQSKDGETLKTWFASHTSVGEASVKNMAQTFTALCAIADFNGTPDIEHEEDDDSDEKPGPRKKRRVRRQLDAQVAFNIQVQIPGEQSPEVYEAIFKNLGKYVLGVVDDE